MEKSLDVAAKIARLNGASVLADKIAVLQAEMHRADDDEDSTAARPLKRKRDESMEESEEEDDAMEIEEEEEEEILNVKSSSKKPKFLASTQPQVVNDVDPPSTSKKANPFAKKATPPSPSKNADIITVLNAKARENDAKTPGKSVKAAEVNSSIKKRPQQSRLFG